MFLGHRYVGFGYSYAGFWLCQPRFDQVNSGMMPESSPRDTFLTRDLPMMSVGGGSASLCPQRQARAWGTMAMSSPRVDDEGPVRIDPASATVSPTVGANYRGMKQQMPRGRLKFGADGR